MPLAADRADAEAALKRAFNLVAAGDVAGAKLACADVISSGDAHEVARAHVVLARCAERSGDPESARLHVESALRIYPDDAAVQYAWALAQERAGNMESAIASLERAVTLQSAFPAALHRLGILLAESGDAPRALDAFERVVALEPANARAFNNLGNALRTLGRTDDARHAFERAVALRPEYELAVANLAVSWRDAGDEGRAETLLRAALSRPADKPPLRALVVALAGLLRERGELDEAESLYRRAIEMAPGQSAGEWFNLGRVHAERDEETLAQAAYLRSHAVDRSDLRAVLASRLSLPMIYEDLQHLERARAAFGKALEQLNDEVEGLVSHLTGEQLLDGLRWTNFFLAYQGRDDRALQASYGAFVARALGLRAPRWRAALETRPSSDRRLRVGFASAFFHVGTAGRYFRSWITDLDRERFEVFVYHLHPGMDEVAAEIRARADRFVEFGGTRTRPSAVAPVIRGDELDVLVYPELGMDHATFALAALRLAPRQLAGWGHPVTSGHATIDGFISCEAMEPAEGRDHYTERLLTLPGIGTRYRPLAVPEATSRSRLKLPEDRPLFLCPQSLFKIHSDNDDLFAAVLSANPEAALVLFDGRHPSVTARFTRRIAAAFERRRVSPERQLIVLPALPHADYLRINLACDAMLDTLHWSGGNTSLDALACGLPIVTVEGAFMRGRQSAAMLRRVGVPELVAADASEYVHLASRLAQDREWRRHLAARIAQGREVLFDDQQPVRAFANMLLDVR
ncbi:MAG: tetratricopeptide repeat protein [Casimicrobiaceae bacterium]